MNALTRILMNAVRAYNAERLNKLTKLAEVGTEKRGAGLYAEKGNKNFLVFFVIEGIHQWECNYEVSSKTDASNIAQAFAEGDVKVGNELAEMQAKHIAELLAPRNDAVAGPAETCGDDTGEGDMHDKSDEWPAVKRPVSYPTAAEMRRLAQEKAEAQRESMDSESDVEPDVDDKLESGEVEGSRLQGIDRHGDPFYDNLDDAITAEDADIEGGIEMLADVSAINYRVDADKKPKIERGRSAKRKAAKRKGNKAPRGRDAQPSNLLSNMFGRNPVTLAE